MSEIDVYLRNRLCRSEPDPEEGWREMSEPVGEAMKLAGPSGYIEFSDDGRWRMHYADGAIVRPEEG